LCTVSGVHRFVLQTEKLCQRSSPHLRAAILAQGKRFMESFHLRQKEKLGMLLANERWGRAEVPTECQTLINNLVRGHGVTGLEVTDAAANVHHLYLNDTPFTVVGSLLMYTKMIAEYCKCAQEMPSMAADILPKLLDCLHFFNRQVCRLVLRAEALKVVQLKTITAKHLALSAQSISVVLLLIPCMRSRFQQHVPPRLQVSRWGAHGYSLLVVAVVCCL